MCARKNVGSNLRVVPKDLLKKKEGKQMKNNQKGITLIALIITIIVMLILVSVTITIAVNNGLFKAAQGATKQTKSESEKEKNTSSGLISTEGREVDIEEYVNSQLFMVEIYDSEWVTNGNRLRVKAKIKEEIQNVEYIEYGFLITTEAQLGDNKEITLDTDVTKVTGIAFSASEGIDVVKGRDGDYKIIEGRLNGIPERMYDANIISRVYVKYTYKGEERILYSNQFITSVTKNINEGKVVEN